MAYTDKLEELEKEYRELEVRLKRLSAQLEQPEQLDDEMEILMMAQQMHMTNYLDMLYHRIELQESWGE